MKKSNRPMTPVALFCYFIRQLKIERNCSSSSSGIVKLSTNNCIRFRNLFDDCAIWRRILRINMQRVIWVQRQIGHDAKYAIHKKNTNSECSNGFYYERESLETSGSSIQNATIQYVSPIKCKISSWCFAHTWSHNLCSTVDTFVVILTDKTTQNWAMCLEYVPYANGKCFHLSKINSISFFFFGMNFCFVRSPVNRACECPNFELFNFSE